MKKVMCFGSFDVLHDGHRNLFKQAKQLGDYLVVVVARDITYNTLRKQEPLHDELVRLQSVNEEALVDKAILGDSVDMYRVLGKERPDVIALGYDQEAFIDDLEAHLQKYNLLHSKIFRMNSYKPLTMKSSLLKK